jgi:ABC-2 type transport system permease protein
VNPVALVARREIRERVRLRSFRVATLISVGVVVAAISIPAAQRGKTPTYDVAVVNPSSPGEVQAVRALAPALKIKERVRQIDTVEEARAALRAGRVDVVVVGTDEILVKRALEREDTGKKSQLITALNGAMRLERAASEAGDASARVLAALRTPVRVRGVEAPRASSTQRWVAFYGVVLLFLFLQQYGAWVLMGVIEEKSSRVVEVLLAAIRPRQLVAGKVLGTGAVALFQGAIVAVAAIVTARATGSHVFEGASRFTIGWMLVWFLLGYGMYSWANAAIGSTVSRQVDAQNASFPVMIPAMVGYISSFSVLSGGDPSTFVRVLAFLPPTAPLVMPMLIGVGKAAPWEVATSAALVVVTIVLLTRVAGDIYARAILHSGRRLRLREVLRREFTAA